MLIKFRYSLVHTEPHNLSYQEHWLVSALFQVQVNYPLPTCAYFGSQRFPSLSQWTYFIRPWAPLYSLSLSTWVLPLPSFQSSTIRPFWSLPSGNLLQSCLTFTIFHFCLISVCKHVQIILQPHPPHPQSFLHPAGLQVITHFPLLTFFHIIYKRLFLKLHTSVLHRLLSWSWL